MEELLFKAINGDKEAFTNIIINLQNKLYKVARARLNNDEDAADAFQETILLAYKNLKKVRNLEYFKTWIIKILINECNKIYRKRKLFYNGQNIELYNNNNELLEVDNGIDFYCIINTLNYEERIIMILYYSSEFTTKEIAKILRKNENTIKTKISRAKQKIKAIYKEDAVYGG